MLRLSKLADYAVVVMHHMGQRLPGTLSNAAQLSEELNLPRPTISKLLKLLVKSRLVLSERGVGGGYQLARLPENITVADIVFAIEGSPAMTECSDVNKVCEHQDNCAVRRNWQALNRTVVKMLQGVSLVDIGQEHAE